jgi:RecB family endonuclease NucS
MRVLIASCSVTYEGRLGASLPRATRLIMIKADGCLAIHSDGGAYKPLNWMNAPNTIEESRDRIVVRNPKGETLTIEVFEVLADFSHELGDDPGLSKDGVEADLQILLAAMPEFIEPGLTLVRREYPTAVGPVDLLCRDTAGRTVAIEIKRRGEIDGVEQLTRYLDCLHADSALGKIRGIFVAQSIKPQARVLAESRNISWCEVDYDALRGKKTDELKLF